MIVGRVTIPVEAPLNRKGGGLNLAGITVTQAMVKGAWEEGEKAIVCNSCGAEYQYLPGKGIVPKGDGAIGEGTEDGEEVPAPAPTGAPRILKPAVMPSVGPKKVLAPSKPLLKAPAKVAAPVAAPKAAPKFVFKKA